MRMLHDYYQLCRMVHTHTWANWFFIYSKPKSSDASVQVAWNITEVCCRILCICQLAFKWKRLCFARSFQMTLTKYTQVLLQGMRRVLGFRSGISCPSGKWFLKLTAMHMEGAQHDHFMFPGDSAQSWRWTEGCIWKRFLEKSSTFYLWLWSMKWLSVLSKQPVTHTGKNSRIPWPKKKAINQCLNLLLSSITSLKEILLPVSFGLISS